MRRGLIALALILPFILSAVAPAQSIGVRSLSFSQMTPEQRTVLVQHVAADPVLSQIPNTLDGSYEIADILNRPAVPEFWVWKSAMTRAEILNALAWTETLALSSGARDTFQLMLSEGTINPSSANIRDAFAKIFSGPQQSVTLANLIAAARRPALRVETLFVTGGSGTAANPATATFLGPISYFDVHAARNP